MTLYDQHICLYRNSGLIVNLLSGVNRYKPAVYKYSQSMFTHIINNTSVGPISTPVEIVGTWCQSHISEDQVAFHGGLWSTQICFTVYHVSCASHNFKKSITQLVKHSFMAKQSHVTSHTIQSLSCGESHSRTIGSVGHICGNEENN